MAKYRKKPVVIEAVQWNVECYPEHEALIVWGEGKIIPVLHEGITKLQVQTLEGPIYASKGDYIIKGISGEFYPCKPDIFEKTYEPVEE